MIGKGFVIETFNETIDEYMFLDNGDRWTSFLTDAKVFGTKEEALQHFQNNPLPNINITIRYY